MSEIFSGTNQTDPRADGESLTYVFDYTSGVSACVTTEKQRVVNELVAAALSAAETAAAIAAIVIGVATAELTLAKRVSLVEDAE